ncbi:class A beta-lactamase-related serine hydrolase [Nonomuraea mesophila]|uniref:Class A beta-lactamase-related serine hydrolase n=1 Tax=Nonomuraea mesophila TaxID=2530382 RepID=A0A4R5FV54_9ACTN|nr:serine hydrolase domain-containing protein [Nonomuraea mesophila]TDE58213.1 class A beta-lactamase-related serine hydrolase [Nonomuraea mesophila]
MHRTKLFGIAGLACAMMTLGSVQPPIAEAGPRYGDVQKALTTLAKNSGIVGAIGELYIDGRKADGGTAGSRLLHGKGGKIPENARYRIGSQGKYMTAIVALQLVEEGKLGLDDKLSDVLPIVAGQDLVELADEITVRHLVQQTSGIPNGHLDIFDFMTDYSPAELVKKTRDLPRTGKPGEKYHYSNTNFILLGMIIEEITGTPPTEEFERRLFDPLEMTRTYGTSKPPEGIKGPHGHGYARDAEGKLRDMDRLNASYGAGTGGVISTARDMGRFFSAYEKGKLLPDDLRQVWEATPPGKPEAPPPAERMCGNEPPMRVVGGAAAGFNAMTFSTYDGRVQFAVSTTLAVEPHAPTSIIQQAAEAVLCPEALAVHTPGRSGGRPGGSRRTLAALSIKE